MVKIAQGYGLSARGIERAEDLESAFQYAFAHKKPCLISVTVRPAGEKCMGIDQSVNPPNYG